MHILFFYFFISFNLIITPSIKAMDCSSLDRRIRKKNSFLDAFFNARIYAKNKQILVFPDYENPMIEYKFIYNKAHKLLMHINDLDTSTLKKFHEKEFLTKERLPFLTENEKFEIQVFRFHLFFNNALQNTDEIKQFIDEIRSNKPKALQEIKALLGDNSTTTLSLGTYMRHTIIISKNRMLLKRAFFSELNPNLINEICNGQHPMHFYKESLPKIISELITLHQKQTHGT